MLLDDYTPMSQYYAEKIGELGAKFNNEHMGRLKTSADSGAVILTESGGSDCGGCESGCQNCEGGCAGTCTGTCTGDCTGTCSDTCVATCAGDCTNSCSADCTNDCKSECRGSCMGECSGICESVCEKCQTYCQNEQKYLKNRVGLGYDFSWDSTPTVKQKIDISASEWNQLADYVVRAAQFCYSEGRYNLTINFRPNPGDAITAKTFNALVKGLEYLDVNASTTLPGTKHGLADRPAGYTPDKIKAEDFNALASRYNGAYINKDLECCQLGETFVFGHDQPCEKGQSCTANSEKGG